MPNRLLITTALISAASALSAPSAFAGGPGTGGDTGFVKAVHQGNLAEIAAGHDAQKNATTACVKNVARVFVRDHGKLDGDVKSLAAKLGIALPASPTPEQKKNLKALQAKAGTAAYDAAWLADQATAHTKTLAAIDQELKAGANSDVVAAARAARPVVAMHLDLVRGGTCHAAKGAAAVGAGTGGHLAARNDRRATIAAFSFAGGGLLTAGATFWLVRRRPIRRRPTTAR